MKKSKWNNEERGAALVIAAGVMLVFLIVGAFAIDSLLIYLTRRELQLAADAAAHAGSVALRDDLQISSAQTPEQQNATRILKEEAFFLAKKAAIETLLANPLWFSKGGFQVKPGSEEADPFTAAHGASPLSYNGSTTESGFISYVEFENDLFFITIQRGYYDHEKQVFINLESDNTLSLNSRNVGYNLDSSPLQIHGVEEEAGVKNCWCPELGNEIQPPSRHLSCSASGTCGSGTRSQGVFTWDVANSFRVFIHLKEYPTFFSKLLGYNTLGASTQNSIIAVSASST